MLRHHAQTAHEWLFRTSRGYRGWSSTRSWAEISRERDGADNVETTAPDGESIKLRAFWLCEAFPVSYTAALERCLRTLERKQVGFGLGRLDETAAGVRASLGAPGGLRWTELGWVTPQNRYPLLRGFDLPLPSDIDRVQLTLYSPLPGLHLLVAGFVLTDLARGRPTALLGGTYRTKVVRERTSTLMYDVEAQKAHAIREFRYRFRKDAARWMSRTLKAEGLFSGGVLHQRLPAVEFWTTRLEEPFPDLGRVPPKYMRALDFTRLPRTWTSDRLAGILLAEAPSDNPALRRDQETPSHAYQLAARESELLTNVGWGATGTGRGVTGPSCRT